MQAAQKMRGNSTSHWDHGHWRKCEADIGYVICSHRFEWLIFKVGFVDGKKLVVLSLADKVASLLPQVTHVILFDFPHTVADYIHRIGRTGRVGTRAKCKASIFMSHREDVRMAWKIKVKTSNMHIVTDL